ncbi:hypothetical protein [Sulfolobus tengchongensis spindle-shaped virus 4]|nr:hypothetical protein [Sulfolobus tengchongensis spindle-shaped virus 4]
MQTHLLLSFDQKEFKKKTHQRHFSIHYVVHQWKMLESKIIVFFCNSYFALCKWLEALPIISFSLFPLEGL